MICEDKTSLWQQPKQRGHDFENAVAVRLHTEPRPSSNGSYKTFNAPLLGDSAVYCLVIGLIARKMLLSTQDPLLGHLCLHLCICEESLRIN